MLICDNKHVFYNSEAGVYRDCVTTDPYPMYETWSCCPECGTTDLSDAIQCPHCEEWTFDDGECIECKKDVSEAIKCETA